MLEMLERVFGTLQENKTGYYSEVDEEVFQSALYVSGKAQHYFVFLLGYDPEPYFMVDLWWKLGDAPYWSSDSNFSKDVLRTEEHARKLIIRSKLLLQAYEVDTSMRKTSFNSVPQPAFEALAGLQGAAQQLAFALLIKDPEIAKVASEAWGSKDKAKDRPSPDRILGWAKEMLESMDAPALVRALVRDCPPLMNSHAGFIQGPLEGFSYPGWVKISLFGLLEEICNEHLRSETWIKVPLETEKEDIAKEMLLRGIPFHEGSRYSLSKQEVDEFLSLHDVSLYLLELRTIKQMNSTIKPEQDSRKLYLCRDLQDGRSVLVRGRSDREAELTASRSLGTVGKVRGVQIDFDAWVLLGGD